MKAKIRHTKEPLLFWKTGCGQREKERVKGCGGKNVKEIEKNMRRRQEGEETARLALTLTPPTACK